MISIFCGASSAILKDVRFYKFEFAFNFFLMVLLAEVIYTNPFRLLNLFTAMSVKFIGLLDNFTALS